jgi:hypothetical protein
MKLEVLKKFADKESGQIYLPGSNFEVKKQKRADELVDQGFLKGEKKSKKESK